MADNTEMPVETKPVNPHVATTCTAGPIGLTAFGITTILLNFLNADLIGKDSITLIICYGMFHGGFIQILAGMWEVYRGNIFGGSASLEGSAAPEAGFGGQLRGSSVGEDPSQQWGRTNPDQSSNFLVKNPTKVRIWLVVVLWCTSSVMRNRVALSLHGNASSAADAPISSRCCFLRVMWIVCRVYRSACIRGAGYLNSAGVHNLEQLLVDQSRCACLRGTGYLNSVKASTNVQSWVGQLRKILT